MLGYGLICVALLFFAGQPPAADHLRVGSRPSSESLVDVAEGWKVGRGDDPKWADPDYDDSQWAPVALPEAWGNKRHVEFVGVVWYRLRARVPASAGGAPLAVVLGGVEHAAYEVYAGGTRVGGYGNLPPAARALPGRPIAFDVPVDAVRGDGRLVLAVRMWRDPDASALAKNFGGDSKGPFLLGPAETLRGHVELTRARALLADLPKIVCATLFTVVGLYHLLLYWRRRQLQEYLWFGTIALGAAASTFVFSTWTDETLSAAVWSGIGMSAFHVNSAAWFEFARVLFGWKASKWIRGYQAVQIALAALAILTPGLYGMLGMAPTLTFLPTFFLWLVLIPREAFRGNPDARTICFGLMALALARIWQVLASFELLPRADLGFVGFAALIFSIAVSLANRFSRVYGELDTLNQGLEGEVARRTAELGETVQRLRVSEKRALEAREAALEANQAKSVFLANMSHELRTPLNAILGFVQLLRRNRSLDTEARESLDVITRSGEHLLGLINDILSISKIEAGKTRLERQAFDLHALLRGLEDTFRLKAKAKRLDLEFELAPDLPRHVSGDAGKVRQVLLNLLGNALKFTEQGRVTLRARPDASGVAFEVEDTGYGIAPEEIGDIFQAFAQSESGRQTKEGTGLGLTISRNVARMMGGDVLVTSEVGRGTTFFTRFDLAVVSEMGMRRERRVVAVEPGHDPVRVLVADDVSENRHVLAELLKSVGLEVREATNGEQALEIWRSWRPHLIWMDVRMPVMDGIEATRRIRAREAELRGPLSSVPWPLPEGAGDEGRRTKDEGPRTIIIALTASAFDHDREGILAAGCDDFATKPFRESVLFEKMTEHLGVRFVYEAGPAEDGAAESKVLPHGLGDMPSEWLAALRHAVTLGDVDKACSIVDQMEPDRAGQAAELRALVRGYRFDEILDAVDAAALES